MAPRLAARQRRAIVALAVLTAAVVPVLSGPAGATPVCNTTPIVFTPPSVPNPAVIPLTPYPSPITITGQTGTISDVNVTFNDISYPRPEDLDVLLVAPDGNTNLFVMSDLGGDNNGISTPLSHVNLTFDDTATQFPPPDSTLVSGTYTPLNDSDIGDFANDTMPAPAPAPSTATALSVFNGLPPNGTWSLYVVDDEPGPNLPGSFAGGWCIDITTDSTTSTSTSTTSTSTTSTSTSTTSTSTSTTVPTSTTSTSTSTTLPPATTSTSVPRGDCDATGPAPTNTPPTARTDPGTVQAGDDTSVSIAGFTPGESLGLTLCSSPVSLATVAADATGNVSARVTIPAATAPGAHTIVVSSADRSRIAIASLTVVASPGTGTGTGGTVSGGGPLARTGADTSRMVGLAVLAVILGFFVVRAARFRRYSSPWDHRSRW